ncbi:hypothetical protein MASR1M60_05770 [Rhodocyclaceae bacterium]
MKSLLKLLAALVLSASAASAFAQALKPFILGSKGTGDLTQKVEEAKKALAGAGFTIVGTYNPYANTSLIVVTNDELKNTAAKSEMGGFGAAQRVSVVKVKDEVQVSYANPIYWSNVYRMAGDLKGTQEKLQAALGKIEEFGAKGLTAQQLRKYHYMMMMPYFDDPDRLVMHASHEEAVKAVEAGLAAGKQGVTKVYRIDIPGKKEVVFGVAMKGEGKDKIMDDKFIMGEIDFKDVKSAAHLPYELLVVDRYVYALSARFRIAASFPDLSMTGENSFMRIMECPDAIRKALAYTAGDKD